jgi:tetratricopeptide (TPR) repeat protein
MQQQANYYNSLFEQLNQVADENTDQAIALAGDFAEAARFRGEEGFALFFEGEALALAGDLRGAHKKGEQALTLLPDVPFMLSNHAVLLSMLGRPKQSLPLLARSLALLPGDLPALSQLGVCLAKLKRYDEALFTFDEILRLQPERAHALRNRAVCLSRLGREAEALAVLEQVLAEHPGDRHARSERKILLDEMRLRRTPLGWIMWWLRKRAFLWLQRNRRQYAHPFQASMPRESLAAIAENPHQ